MTDRGRREILSTDSGITQGQVETGRDVHAIYNIGTIVQGTAGSTVIAPVWRVFVSYTSELRDFPRGMSYVAAVERAISASGYVFVNMADFPTADEPAAQVCAERVRGCDVYVAVLGTRYGTPVRDKPDMSYAELEFNAATEAGLDRLMFLLDIDAADVGIPVKDLIDLKFGDRQEAFRRRVQGSGLVTQKFADPGTLGQMVERSLRELPRTRRRGGIFISYRRKESSHFAGRLSDRLADSFGTDRVFMDVDTIQPGVDFTQAIGHAVKISDVLLAIIGPHWLATTDEDGQRRLNDPDDIVRLEIEAALTSNVRIIPILVDDTAMPRRQDLPESLAGLVRFNASAIRHDTFRSDTERLITTLQSIVSNR
jgi:hypothetical protein